MTPINNQFFTRSVWIATICYITFLLLPREETFIWINQFRHPIADIYFQVANLLGDGWIILGVFALALFIDFRLTLAVVISAVLVLLFVSIGKQWLYPDVLRPAAAINGTVLETLDGIALRNRRSFPSGHTTTAFAMAYIILSRSKGISIKIFLAVLAISAACARVYLVQHFPEDVCMGAILGIAAAAIALLSTDHLPAIWDKNLIFRSKQIRDLTRD